MRRTGQEASRSILLHLISARFRLSFTSAFVTNLCWKKGAHINGGTRSDVLMAKKARKNKVSIEIIDTHISGKNFTKQCLDPSDPSFCMKAMGCQMLRLQAHSHYFSRWRILLLVYMGLLFASLLCARNFIILRCLFSHED